ncbi:hypothetical protein ACVW0J_009726 [Bradyrhizobium sp. i1.7.7]
MDADGQPTALATRAGLETSGHCISFAHDAPGGIEEFLTFNGRSRTATCALEQSAAQLAFEIAQAATKSRLLDVERLRRLPQASVLGRSDRPA